MIRVEAIDEPAIPTFSAELLREDQQSHWPSPKVIRGKVVGPWIDEK
jgi:hypothetical protein